MAHWLLNTAGVGSLMVMIIGGLVLLAYVAMLRWVQSAPPAPPAPIAETSPKGEP